MENIIIEKVCDHCRFWYVDDPEETKGLCRRRAPQPNGDEPAIWPITACDDSCGEFAYKEIARGRNAPKVSDEEIIALIKDYGDSPTRRYWIAKDLVTKKGLAKSSANERIKSLVRRGLAEVGVLNPPEYPRMKDAVCIWLPGTQKAVAPVLDSDEAPLPGRPAYQIDQFLPEIVAAFPDAAHAGRRADVTRVMRKKVETLGQGTVYRLIDAMVAAGALKLEGGLFCACGTETLPAD